MPYSGTIGYNVQKKGGGMKAVVRIPVETLDGTIWAADTTSSASHAARNRALSVFNQWLALNPAWGMLGTEFGVHHKRKLLHSSTPVKVYYDANTYAQSGFDEPQWVELRDLAMAMPGVAQSDMVLDPSPAAAASASASADAAPPAAAAAAAGEKRKGDRDEEDEEKEERIIKRQCMEKDAASSAAAGSDFHTKLVCRGLMRTFRHITGGRDMLVVIARELTGAAWDHCNHKGDWSFMDAAFNRWHANNKQYDASKVTSVFNGYVTPNRTTTWEVQPNGSHVFMSDTLTVPPPSIRVPLLPASAAASNSSDNIDPDVMLHQLLGKKIELTLQLANLNTQIDALRSSRA